MAFKDDFDELERMLTEKSSDHEKMLAKLQAISRLKEFARMMSPAQDRLYASIARGHRKVFKHLENGDIAAATRETAKVIAWFYIRFQGEDPDKMPRCQQIAEELSGVLELVARSEILRDAISKTTGSELHEA
jgi:hypothetical protein